jgi:3'(2'), 5'-bisphosphate nucleotidase
LKEIIETVAPVDIKRIGGAGNKCANVAVGNVDSYIYPQYGLKYWDLCAPEVLIKAMGGYATNVKEEKLTYFPETDRRIAGLLLSKNP